MWRGLLLRGLRCLAGHSLPQASWTPLSLSVACLAPVQLSEASRPSKLDCERLQHVATRMPVLLCEASRTPVLLSEASWPSKQDCERLQHVATRTPTPLSEASWTPKWLSEASWPPTLDYERVQHGASMTPMSPLWIPRARSTVRRIWWPCRSRRVLGSLICHSRSTPRRVQISLALMESMFLAAVTAVMTRLRFSLTHQQPSLKRTSGCWQLGQLSAQLSAQLLAHLGQLGCACTSP